MQLGCLGDDGVSSWIRVMKMVVVLVLMVVMMVAFISMDADDGAG